MSDKYQVAISFAGEQRAYAEEVAKLLQACGVAIFYDEYETARLWGTNLVEELYRVYAKESSYILMLVSRDYIQKKWCIHERRAAFDKLLNEDRGVILPVKFDDAWPDGLATSTGYVEHTLTPSGVSSLLLEKIGVRKDLAKLSHVPPPRNTSEIAEIAFDYSNFNGRYIIGSGTGEFETNWSTSDGRSIVIYNDPSSIKGVAIAYGAKSFQDLIDVSAYDFSSRTRRPHVGDYAVLLNTSGRYAVVQIKSVKSREHGAGEYHLRIFYVIGRPGETDFSPYHLFE
jgi:hypothetical protein